MQALVVEPRDVFDDRELELRAGAPDAVGDELGLEAVDEALGQRVVVGVADRADRGQHGVIVEDLREGVAGVLGGFNRSSQRLDERRLRWAKVKAWEKAGRAGCGRRAAAGRAAGASAVVLGGDRAGRRKPEAAAFAAGSRGRSASGGFGRVAGCRRSRCSRRRGGTCRLPSARRSRCCAPRARACARSRAGSALAVDDLAGVAAQRRDARRALDYRATVAQWHAEQRAKRPKPAKLAVNEQAA